MEGLDLNDIEDGLEEQRDGGLERSLTGNIRS
jgi:hypothetical protein